MSSPVRGARDGRGGKDTDLRLRLLERAVANNGERITKLERWIHYTAGALSGTTVLVLINTVRGIVTGDAS